MRDPAGAVRCGGIGDREFADAVGAVAAIHTTPVKGLGLHSREAVALSERGVADNRMFFLVDGRGTLINGKRIGELASVLADHDAGSDTLTLRFPDGRVESERALDGEPVETQFFSRRPLATPVCPVLSAALSAFIGQDLRLMRADPALTAIDRGPGASVSLVSLGSLEHLGELAGQPIDGRRFRMLFDVSGLGPHAEDALVGRQVRIGSALIHFHGHVGRCRVTKMDPDTGAVTLETLDLISSYRSDLDTTEPLAFGIYGEVLRPGNVRLGDPVSVVIGPQS